MSGAVYLQPVFDAMPAELRAVARWVTWKDVKVPYCPTAVNSKASVIDPGTWGTFVQAQTAYEEGGYLGVGFVLAAAIDGIVGVDLDKCVQANVPDPVALALLERIGCQYVELSPSGTGLRGFGYSEPIKGTKGLIDGIKTELYASGHYLTVTGHPVKQGSLVPLHGFLEAADAIRGVNGQKSQKNKKQSSGSSFSSASSVSDIPSGAVPTQPGMRNKCVFELARYLKGVRPNSTRLDLRPLVESWYERYLPLIDTKDFSVTWTDFLNAWNKVEQPHGEQLGIALASLDLETPLPDAIRTLEYGDKGNYLVRICMALQKHFGSEPFFISARSAGKLLDVNKSDAAKMLSLLVSDGVLTLVRKGEGLKASRYRMAESLWRA